MLTEIEHITAVPSPLGANATGLEPAIEQVLQRVRLRARRRVAWLRAVWMAAGARSNGNGQGIHLEIDGYLDNADTPAAEARWYAETPEIQALNAAIAMTEEGISADTESRLAQLQRTFDLNAAEMDLLQVCLALAVEPNLGRVYAYLHDHSTRSYPTENLTARLFGHGYCLPLSNTSPLKTWELVLEHPAGPGEPTRFELDTDVRNWLLGMDDLDASLNDIAQALSAPEPLEHWPLDTVVQQLTAWMTRPDARALRVFVAGPEGSGRRSFAACVSEGFGLPVLVIDSDRVADARWPSTYMHAQRYAYLNRCALVWYGAAAVTRHWPAHIPACRLQFVTGEVEEHLPPAADLLDLRIELPPMTLEQRRQLWLRHLPAAAHWPADTLETLVRRRQTHIGQVKAAAARSVGSAAEAAETASEAARRRLGGLAQHLQSDFSADDLVLPSWLHRHLDDFIFEATERVLLWEQPAAQRLFPQGRGLLALFTGPPGTGKTMAAQVIANTLELDLFRVDLSTIVSKYVGETSKNIERILSRAQRMDAVLLFDEADALFGKRTDIKDAHDRFANTDTNYLLQAIEQYPGIAILSSNRKANIDQGFTRRLRYILDFPKPDAPQRLQLWQRITGELCGPKRTAALQHDLVRLAEAVELTGAQIKYAVLSAVYIARKTKEEVNMAHLILGLERELLKEGRGLGQQVRESLKN